MCVYVCVCALFVRGMSVVCGCCVVYLRVYAVCPERVGVVCQFCIGVDVSLCGELRCVCVCVCGCVRACESVCAPLCMCMCMCGCVNLRGCACVCACIPAVYFPTPGIRSNPSTVLGITPFRRSTTYIAP